MKNLLFLLLILCWNAYFQPSGKPYEVRENYHSRGGSNRIPKVRPLSPFENIHIYPLIARILGLDYEPDSIDGDIKVLKGILVSD